MGALTHLTKVAPYHLSKHPQKPGVEPTTGAFQLRWLGMGERGSGRGARSCESNQRRRRTPIGPQADHHHTQEARSPAAIPHDTNQVRVGWPPKPAGRQQQRHRREGAESEAEEMKRRRRRGRQSGTDRRPGSAARIAYIWLVAWSNGPSQARARERSGSSLSLARPVLMSEKVHCIGISPVVFLALRTTGRVQSAARRDD